MPKYLFTRDCWSIDPVTGVDRLYEAGDSVLWAEPQARYHLLSGTVVRADAAPAVDIEPSAINTILDTDLISLTRGGDVLSFHISDLIDLIEDELAVRAQAVGAFATFDFSDHKTFLSTAISI